MPLSPRDALLHSTVAL